MIVYAVLHRQSTYMRKQYPWRNSRSSSHKSFVYIDASVGPRTHQPPQNLTSESWRYLICEYVIYTNKHLFPNSMILLKACQPLTSGDIWRFSKTSLAECFYESQLTGMGLTTPVPSLWLRVFGSRSYGFGLSFLFVLPFRSGLARKEPNTPTGTRQRDANEQRMGPRTNVNCNIHTNDKRRL